MERTWDCSVDNGLYALGYYLNKNIKDITPEDIANSGELMTDVLVKYTYKGSYIGSLVYMTHMNSCLTQSTSGKKTKIKANFKEREEYIQKNIKELLETKNDSEAVLVECSICGKKEAYKGNENANKKHMMGVASENFSNSFNNMQDINICPHCLYLSLLSCLNTIKYHGQVMLMSDSNKFMKRITKQNQESIISSLLTEQEDMNQESYINFIIANDNKEKRLKDGNYIEVINFNNGGQKNTLSKNILSNDKIQLIKEIKFKGLLYTFHQINGLYYAIENDCNLCKPIARMVDNESVILMEDESEIKEKLEKKIYINKNELMDIYEMVKEFEMGDKKDLIRKIIKKLREYYTKEEINKKFRLINNKNDFRNFLIDENDKVNFLDSLEEFEKAINDWLNMITYLKFENTLKNN